MSLGLGKKNQSLKLVLGWGQTQPDLDEVWHVHAVLHFIWIMLSACIVAHWKRKVLDKLNWQQYPRTHAISFFVLTKIKREKNHSTNCLHLGLNGIWSTQSRNLAKSSSTHDIASWFGLAYVAPMTLWDGSKSSLQWCRPSLRALMV